ncbi:unnamed protein product [Mytilus coruscus]|uniref:DMBT1 n=1 Tax=Mytilus coruscus TaxID=42192 RepID=A0A6J8CXZ5_MYTCO|nr:unnamed protein product [Mytilus coruscus]
MGTFIEHFYRNSQVIIAYNNMGLKMCGRHCLLQKSCTAVNYNSVSLLCELLAEIATDLNVTIHEFRYSAIDTWSLTDDYCYPNPCSGNERCVKTKTDAYNCLTISTPCDDVICQNGGTCKNGPSTFTCQCVEGYYGAVCEATPCDDVICQNGGTCKNGPSTFNCQCVEGFYGAVCEATPCDDVICQNGGTCKNGPSTFTCQCVEDYYGAVCEDYIEVWLVDGSHSLEGRVEIYVNGAWGTICDDEFGEEEARVICGMLGYSNNGSVPYSAYSDAYFGQGSGSIVLDDLNCIGTETNIFDCQSNGLFNHDCEHSEDAGVACQDARVVGMKCETEDFVGKDIPK